MPRSGGRLRLERHSKLDTNLIRSLKPDLLIPKLLRSVARSRRGCAACRLRHAGQVLALTRESCCIYEGIRNVARALDREEAGEALVEQMAHRIGVVTAAVAEPKAADCGNTGVDRPGFSPRETGYRSCRGSQRKFTSG